MAFIFNLTTHFDPWIHKGIDEIEQEDGHCQQVGVDDRRADNDGNIIQTDRLIQRPPETRPEEDRLGNGGTGPQGDYEQGKVRDDIRQCRAQDVMAFHIARGESLGFRHIHVIFTGIDEEKCAIVINAEEE